jgi:hypothetical protein
VSAQTCSFEVRNLCESGTASESTSLWKWQALLSRCTNFEDIQRHGDERAVAKQTDQIDHGRDAKPFDDASIARVANAPGLIELKHEVEDQPVVDIVEARRLACLDGSGDVSGQPGSKRNAAVNMPFRLRAPVGRRDQNGKL